MPRIGDGCDPQHRHCHRSRSEAGENTERTALSGCALRIAHDPTSHPLFFNLGLDQLDAGHEVAPETIDLEGRSASHEVLNLRFIQAGYYDHGFLSSLLG